MKQLVILLLFSVTSANGNNLSASRPIIKDIREGSRSEKFHEFVYPYLIVQTASRSDKSVSAVVKGVQKYMRKFELPYKAPLSKATGSTVAISESNFKFPKEIWEGSNRRGMEKCSRKYCRMKLNTNLEKRVVEKSKDKIATFKNLVIERIRRYQNQRMLWGYEKREDNVPAVRDMVKYLHYMRKDYPLCSKLIVKDFWNKADSKCKVLSSSFTKRVVRIDTEMASPILRLGHLMHLQEGKRHLFFHLFVYTNHYFDFAAKTIEVFPMRNGKTVVVLTDFLEIDELTKSSVVRFLYTGKMAKGIRKIQWNEIQKLR